MIKFLKPLIFAFIVCLALNHTGFSQKKDIYIPTTISTEWQQFMKLVAGVISSAPPVVIPASNDIEGWKRFRAQSEQTYSAFFTNLMKRYKQETTEKTLGGVKVLEIKPEGWKDDGKLVVYIHGGGYTQGSAKTSLLSPSLFSEATGLRTISIDYTLAPEGDWKMATEEVTSVFKALKAQKISFKNIVIFGDSAGGSLAAGSVLKMRDEGIGMPGAVVLWSPWSDITDNGDTYYTLKTADFLLSYEGNLKNSADAYAKPEDQKNPYVSPVYGDYSKGFPPTLIQVGTKEVFVSNAVRHYQAIEAAGGTAKLDVYEGMPHVFQAFVPDSPESKLAMKKVNDFVKQYLGKTAKR